MFKGFGFILIIIHNFKIHINICRVQSILVEIPINHSFYFIDIYVYCVIVYFYYINPKT